MNPIPPHLQANLDQAQAMLRDLTTSARDHHETGCHYPSACPGRAALDWIQTHRHDSAAILTVALIERAKASMRPTWVEVVDSVADTLLACNADVVVDQDTRSAAFVDEPRWRRQAARIVDELVRIGALDGGGAR